MKSKEELIKYSISILERGDSYYDIERYLNRNCDDAELKKKIISGIARLEKENKINIPKSKSTSPPKVSIILGTSFILGGIVLGIYLGKEGVFATIPIILLIIGVLALIGKFK